MAGYSQARGDLIWYELAKKQAGTNARELFNFLLFPPTERLTVGVRRFIPGEALPFMLDWSHETAQEALNALVAADLVEYDQEACLVFVPLALAMQDYKGPKQVSGAARAVLEHPESPVLAAPLAHLAGAARAAAAAARERAEGLKDASKKKGALKDAEQMEELARELDRRRARLVQGGLAMDAPSEIPADSAAIPPVKGIDRVSGNGAKGMDTLSETPPEGGEMPQGRGVDTPAQRVSIGYHPSEKGIDRVSSRARGRDARPYPYPEPEFSGEDPPKKAPPARDGPPEPVGGIIGRIGGRSRGS